MESPQCGLKIESDAIARFDNLHEKLLRKKLFHGIEVVNEHTYSEEALALALENNLTIMGTSDIHGLIDWTFDKEKESIIDQLRL